MTPALLRWVDAEALRRVCMNVAGLAAVEER